MDRSAPRQHRFDQRMHLMTDAHAGCLSIAFPVSELHFPDLQESLQLPDSGVVRLPPSVSRLMALTELVLRSAAAAGAGTSAGLVLTHELAQLPNLRWVTPVHPVIQTERRSRRVSSWLRMNACGARSMHARQTDVCMLGFAQQFAPLCWGRACLRVTSRQHQGNNKAGQLCTQLSGSASGPRVGGASSARQWPAGQ